MRALPLDRSQVTFWDDLVFLEAALLAGPGTALLAARVGEHLERHDVVAAAYKAGRRALLQASARARMADEALDDELRTLHSAALHATRQDHTAPAYVTLFPDGLSWLLRHGLEQQVALAAGIVDRLGLRLYDEAFRAAHVPALEAAIAAGREALEARRRAETRRESARLEVQAWKEEANALRLGVFSELLAVAARERRGRAWAEAFFMPVAGRRRAAGEDAEPAADEEPSVS
jgi:hypothetical protein